MNDKSNIRRHILLYKRAMRHNLAMAAKLRDEVRQLRREQKFLQRSVFNHHRVGLVNEEIAITQTALRKLVLLRKQVSQSLYELMQVFDTYSPTAHEVAQLLSISHATFERFVALEPDKCGALYVAAFLGAETFGEKDVFVGQRPARDNPLWRATHDVLMSRIESDPVFKQKVVNDMYESFGALPRYRFEIADDGTEYLDRIPPDLKLVKA